MLEERKKTPTGWFSLLGAFIPVKTEQDDKSKFSRATCCFQSIQPSMETLGKSQMEKKEEMKVNNDDAGNQNTLACK